MVFLMFVFDGQQSISVYLGVISVLPNPKSSPVFLLFSIQYQPTPSPRILGLDPPVVPPIVVHIYQSLTTGVHYYITG